MFLRVTFDVFKTVQIIDEHTQTVRFRKTNVHTTTIIMRHIRNYFIPTNVLHVLNHKCDFRNLRDCRNNPCVCYDKNTK